MRRMSFESESVGAWKPSVRAMKLLFKWLAALGFSVIAGVAQSQINDGHEAARSSTCGPQEYCVRTDRRVEVYPDKAPAIGPAGSIISDPTFGSRILRVTDSGSDPVQANRSLVTPSSAEQNSWNKDSTMFYVTTLG